MIGKKVLLIDDDINFLKLASVIFKESGAWTITARDGLDGIGKLFTHQPNLILLDVQLPGVDGFQTCQRIRQFSNTPLIMVSPVSQDDQLLKGLEAGADDFLYKPVNPEVLLARARAVMRRSRQKNGNSTVFNYNDGRLQIDVEKHRVQVGGKDIRLTPVEFRLLAYLAGSGGRVLSYEQILFSVWGGEYKGNDDYVHVYVSHLRNKIEENPKQPRYIRSIYGVGYVFEKQDSINTYQAVDNGLFIHGNGA